MPVLCTLELRYHADPEAAADRSWAPIRYAYVLADLVAGRTVHALEIARGDAAVSSPGLADPIVLSPEVSWCYAWRTNGDGIIVAHDPATNDEDSDQEHQALDGLRPIIFSYGDEFNLFWCLDHATFAAARDPNRPLVTKQNDLLKVSTCVSDLHADAFVHVYANMELATDLGRLPPDQCARIESEWRTALFPKLVGYYQRAIHMIEAGRGHETLRENLGRVRAEAERREAEYQRTLAGLRQLYDRLRTLAQGAQIPLAPHEDGPPAPATPGIQGAFDRVFKRAINQILWHHRADTNANLLTDYVLNRPLPDNNAARWGARLLRAKALLLLDELVDVAADQAKADAFERVLAGGTDPTGLTDPVADFASWLPRRSPSSPTPRTSWISLPSGSPRPPRRSRRGAARRRSTVSFVGRASGRASRLRTSRPKHSSPRATTLRPLPSAVSRSSSASRSP